VYTVASLHSQFLDDLEVRVVSDTRDEPAVILVDTVKQPEIVEAQIKEYKAPDTYSPMGSWLRS
jgi:hypothetical protein